MWRNQNRGEFIKALKDSFKIDEKTRDLIYQDLLKSFQYASESRSLISMIPFNFHLSPNPNESSNEITKIPSKIKSEEILSIDLGGSTIRIALIRVTSLSSLIVPDKAEILNQQSWNLSEDDKFIDMKFYERLVSKALSVILNHVTHINGNSNDSNGTTNLKKYPKDLKQLKVGIGWSFPLDSKNVILKLGKGFSIDPKVSNQSIDKILKSCFDHVELNVDIKIIINDSLAVSLAGMVNNEHDTINDSNISLIIGTGINSCIKDSTGTFYNTELGFFGKLFNVTKYDLLIDSNWKIYNETLNFKPFLEQETNSPLFQPLEFLCSSRYICGTISLILKDLISLDLLKSSKELTRLISEQYSLHGRFVTCFTEQSNSELIEANLSENFSLSLSKEEITIIAKIIDIVLDRSAIYVSTSLLALHQYLQVDFISEIDYKEHSGIQHKIQVNFIGSFLSHCYTYQQKIIHFSANRLVLREVKDSNVLGAAIAAFIEG